MGEMQEEFEEMLEVAEANIECFDNISGFTFENYVTASYHASTRCFGYAVPGLALVPFADMANHHTTDNWYEVFNLRISSKIHNNPDSINVREKNYITRERGKIDFFTNLPVELKQKNSLPLEKVSRPLNR